MIKSINKILDEGRSLNLKYPEAYYEQEMYSKGEVVKAIIKERQRILELIDWTYKNLDMGKTIPIFIQRIKDNFLPKDDNIEEYSDAVKEMMEKQSKCSQPTGKVKA